MIPLPHEQLTNDQIIVRLATKLAGLKLMIEELEYKILDMVTAHIEQAKMEDLVAAAPKTEEDILLLATRIERLSTCTCGKAIASEGLGKCME
jgi:hypothetical protein